MDQCRSVTVQGGVMSAEYEHAVDHLVDIIDVYFDDESGEFYAISTEVE